MGYRRPIDSQLNRLLPVKAIERYRQLIRTCAVGFLGRPFSRPSSSHQRLLTSGQEKASNVSAHGQARIRRDYPAHPPLLDLASLHANSRPLKAQSSCNSQTVSTAHLLEFPGGERRETSVQWYVAEIGDPSRRRGDDFRLKLSIRARPPERVFDGCFHRFHALIRCPQATADALQRA